MMTEGADARIHMDRRLECPECSHASMIFNRKTLLKAMEYVCPDCGNRLLAEPPDEPPSQPTLPTGGIMGGDELIRERQERKAA